MLRYKILFKNDTFFVSLNSSSPNQKSMVEYQGDDVSELRSIVSRMTGAFGHLIGNYTTPIDLHCAFLNQDKFSTEIIEGKGLVGDYDPQIPEGSVT